MQSLIALTVVLLGALGVAAAGAVPPPSRGDVVLSSNFDSSTPLAEWPGNGVLDAGYQGSKAMLVERLPGSTVQGAFSRYTVPIDRIRGCMVRISGMVRAEGVSNRPQPWNGIKMMMPITQPGGTLYPQAKIDVGTFDWRQASCVVRVPSDAVSAVLHLGLEEVTGRAWFDNIRIVVLSPPPPEPRPVKPGAIFRGHSLPRLRGAMVSPAITPDSLRTFGHDWNANLVRWQVIRSNSQAVSQPDYDKWLDGELARLDAALPICRKQGLLVVVDLHSPPGGAPSPGGYAAADADLFSGKACQARFVEVWQRIARRYKGVPGIWGFDLVNEPIEDSLAEDTDDWSRLAERAGRAIRAIDPSRTLIVECAAGANPGGFDSLTPLPLPNVVYSVHMYLPHAFTHQGVFGPSPDVVYPGMVEGRRWDRAQLLAALKPVMEFQKRYGVHIYVGEFSAIRWAPDDSACRYLKDLVEIFEGNGWDWSYHAFREWDGWSVEHGADRNDHSPTVQPTTRQAMLRSWYARNRKPPARP